MAQKCNHWGDWILARARAVGFRRLLDLAKAVGCTPERITQWASMKVPPKKMRKGFDRSLAVALSVTPTMLFSDWETIGPDSAERWGVNVAAQGMIETIGHANEAREFLELGMMDRDLSLKIGELLQGERAAVDSYYSALRAGDYDALTKARAAMISAAATTAAEIEKLRVRRFYAPSKPVRKPSKPPSKPQ